MEAVAADGVSVVFSSHVLSELERVCDYLMLLSGGSVQVAAGTVDEPAGHATGCSPVRSNRPTRWRQPCPVRAASGGPGGWQAFWSAPRTTTTRPPGWQDDPSNLEEIVLGYLRSPDASALPGPHSRRASDNPRAVTGMTATAVSARRTSPRVPRRARPGLGDLASAPLRRLPACS